MENGTATRSDNVTLNASTLITSGGSGHIGNLNSKSGSVLTVRKDNGTTYPLLVDGNVTQEGEERLKLKAKGITTEPGAIMLTFTDGANADESLYVDGGDNNLTVIKLLNKQDKTKMDILFAVPMAHTVEAYVEYDVADLTSKVDDQNSLAPKYLNFVYDKTNDHPVVRGYVIAMPEAKVNDADATKSGIRAVETPDPAVQASDEGVYTFTVSQEDLKANADQNVIWVYGKDSVNNTVRFAIPMSEEMIDITVPLRVSLVAIKKNAADVDANVPKLLAPTCYVKNNGVNKVKVAVSGFTAKTITGETADTSGLTLSEKHKGATDFTSKEISLFVKKDANLTNVKKLAKQTDALGNGPMEIGEVETTQLLDFTFDAGYNPTGIVETTNWLTHEMSYNVSVVKNQATQP